MRLTILRMYLFALLAACCSQSFAAAPVLLERSSSGASLNGQIELLEDVGAKLNVADMADPAVQQRFIPANGKASVGQSRNPWWIKVSLQRRSSAPQNWWLEVGSVTQLNMQLYLPGPHTGWTQRQGGEVVNYADGRDHPYRRTLFKLPELGEEPLTFYLRTYDPAGNSFPLKVWQLDDLSQLAATENIGLGVIYGIITALLLYNLFIFFSLRDSAYFWYVLATAGALLFIVSMTGHGFQYLWPNHPVPVWLDRIVLPSLWGLFASRFTQTLMQTRRYVRWAHHLLNLACAMYIVAIVIDFFGDRGTAAWIIAMLSFTSIPAALGSAFIRWRQQYFPAFLYLCGYGLILGSTGLLLMRTTGVIQPADWNAYVFPLAVAAESILFSFALAYRIQTLKHDRSIALQQADREKTARLSQIQASADELKRAVQLRTAELAEANTQLAEANQQLREREQALQHAAFHDPLTDLPNRRYLIERVETSLADASRRQESVALLLVDLDHFKPINDRHGHDAGDLMLRTIGQRLREHVRSNDMVARLGGDEFAIVISGPEAEQHAQEIAVRLLTELARPVLYGANNLAVTISIGAALFPQHAKQFAGLYKAADEALYQAKSQGRSGCIMRGKDGSLSPEQCLFLDVLQVPTGLV
ncbi:sensor domain-containing diguanylate cyclase [Pseudomonas turukhanskensis]|uniref:Sensor domain-containing diguanylate cyclase n=2 Tax=Pseudomonas turukhanskensis TaxID=1806536 RepID=A0A9W6NEF7_9PSED|nr:sensor domain-containing diguanylate cyclase [Pseudomonas turukhanskensis]